MLLKRNWLFVILMLFVITTTGCLGESSSKVRSVEKFFVEWSQAFKNLDLNQVKALYCFDNIIEQERAEVEDYINTSFIMIFEILRITEAEVSWQYSLLDAKDSVTISKDGNSAVITGYLEKFSSKFDLDRLANIKITDFSEEAQDFLEKGWEEWAKEEQDFESFVAEVLKWYEGEADSTFEITFGHDVALKKVNGKWKFDLRAMLDANANRFP